MGKQPGLFQVSIPWNIERPPCQAVSHWGVVVVCFDVVPKRVARPPSMSCNVDKRYTRLERRSPVSMYARLGHNWSPVISGMGITGDSRDSGWI